MVVKKHGAKIFFVIACFLFALSLAFSAYSYARFVTSAGVNSGGVDMLPIECEVTVNNGGGSPSFINAPFMQKISDNTKPVRMNSWAETTISLRNNGAPDKLKYECSIVLYFPEEFAASAMFQFLELGKPESGREEEPVKLVDAVKASELYKITPALGESGVAELEKVVATSDGVVIENDYQSLIDENKLLKISPDSGAELQNEIRSVPVSSTFATYNNENGITGFVTPVSVRRNTRMRFYRITVNFAYDKDPNEYVISGGETKSFVLRLVLLESRTLNAEWNVSELWKTETDASGETTYIEPIKTPSVESDHECRWAVKDTGEYDFENGKPFLQIKKKTESAWKNVVVSETCIGLISPVKISGVFTQVPN